MTDAAPPHPSEGSLSTDPSIASATRRSLHGRVLLIFLDGVGIGASNRERNPFVAAPLPFLKGVLNGSMPVTRRNRIETPDAIVVPANATLRVAGLPQSGTGQSTLYTGRNTARMIGRHFGPYLYSTIRPVVAAHNLFAQAIEHGVPRRDIALANAFPQRFFDYLAGPRKRMVAGMYAALATRIPFRSIVHLTSGTAVSTDITAARWKDIGHPDAPVIPPREAGHVLASIARSHRVTLFEYFLTDKAGHERHMHGALSVLADVDAFLHGVFERSDLSSTLVVITSDHGNIEDLSTKSHTRNPVPVIAFGRGRTAFARRVRTLVDVVPALIDALS